MTTPTDEEAGVPTQRRASSPPPRAGSLPAWPPSKDPEPERQRRWSGTLSIDAVYGDGDHERKASWFVEVYPSDSGVGIERRVQVWDTRGDGAYRWCDWEPQNRWRPERVIWPSWTAGEPAGERTALDSVHDSWRNSSDRIRDAAKWMATVIGASLATIVGTSPLTAFSDSRPTGWAVALGLTGLSLLATTMVLVLQVLRPGDTSYVDVQRDGGRSGHFRMLARLLPERLRDDPLTTWRDTVENQQDLWLPSGVKCLTTLRQAMIVDELTLMALSCAVTNGGLEESDVGSLQEAQAVRVARLEEFRQAAARVVAVGEFHRLRRRSDVATYLGAPMSTVGTIMVILAFVVLP